jgi:hypothetical protein
MYVYGCKLITRCLTIASILILELLFTAGLVQAAVDPPSPDIIIRQRHLMTAKYVDKMKGILQRKDKEVYRKNRCF